MDDIKLQKNEKDLATFWRAVRIYYEDIRMEFGLKNLPCE